MTWTGANREHLEEKRFYQAKVAGKRDVDSRDNVSRPTVRWMRVQPVKGCFKVDLSCCLGPLLIAAMAVGCREPVEAPPESDTDILIEEDISEHLRALGYVAWDEDADQSLSGTILRDASAVEPGANLYTNDEDAVLLIDVEGAVLRRWDLPGRKHCEHAELLSSGRLAVLCEREAVVILEPDGTVALEVPGNVHHDVAELGDGSLLVPVRDDPRVYRGRSVVFDSILQVFPDGSTRPFWSTFGALETLQALHAQGELDTWPSPRILAHYLWRWLRGKTINDHDYYHLNAVAVLGATRLGKSDPRFRSGNLLISLRNADTLVILDRDTLEPVWHWGEGHLELPHDPSWLPHGRLLVFDNGTRRGYSRVLEIDPRSGETTWQYPKQGERSLFSEWRGSSQRLAGGNTLICESERGHVLEVTPEGEVVWEFWNPELGDEGRKRIYRFSRLTPASTALLLDKTPR